MGDGFLRCVIIGIDEKRHFVNNCIVAARRQQGVLRGGHYPLDYKGKRVMCMTTYETIMVILGFLNCLLTVLIAYINNNKK